MVPKGCQRDNLQVYNWRDIELQQATGLIGACRTTRPCEDQKLNSFMSRRGQSFVIPHFQKILVIAEQYFRRKTEVSYLREIDVKKNTYDLVKLKCIKEYFAEIVEERELKPYGIVSDDVLHGINELYMKVRSFSPARYYAQKHRCLKEGTRKNELRTELKRKNDHFHQKNHELKGKRES